MPARILQVALIATLAFYPAIAVAQGTCSLSPVFLLFRQVAGPDVVGECKEPAVLSESGDITQATTRGLAVYRYADQVIAFTDGQTTWLYGPEGLQKRTISDKFAWEQTVPVARVEPTVPAPATRAATATPVPPTPTPQPASKLTPALGAKCSNLGFDLASEMAPKIGAEAAKFGQLMTDMCRSVVDEHGEAGFSCFDPAARQLVRDGSRMKPGPNSGETAVNGFRARVDSCLSNLSP